MTKQTDTIEKKHGATIQHGPLNDRIYLMKVPAAYAPSEAARIGRSLLDLAQSRGYGKIFAKVRTRHAEPLLQAGFAEEGRIPWFYEGMDAAVFLGFYLREDRAREPDPAELNRIVETALVRRPAGNVAVIPQRETILRMTPDRADEMAAIYREVFPTYPFPIHEPKYLIETMESHVAYFGVKREGRLVSLSSAEMDRDARNVEMTDFATLPDHRSGGFATQLLAAMESHVREEGIKTAYTIARAASFGMNIAFAKNAYEFGGRLVNNTNISGSIESMNLWYKRL